MTARVAQDTHSVSMGTETCSNPLVPSLVFFSVVFQKKSYNVFVFPSIIEFSKAGTYRSVLLTYVSPVPIC